MEEQQSQVSEPTKDESEEVSARLGIIYDIPGVDSEYVPMFAKALRALGFLAVATLVLWGLFGEWDYVDSPFEELAKALGIGYRNRDVAAYGMGGMVLLAGWFFRFHIGAAISALVFGLFSVARRIFKAV